MMIQSKSHTENNGNQYFELHADKKAAFIEVTPAYITVICQEEQIKLRVCGCILH